MTKTWVVTLFAFLCCIALSCASAAKERGALVELSGVLVEEGGHTFLELTLSNSSETTLTFYRSHLPWTAPGRLSLIAVMEDDETTLLEQVFPIRDQFDISEVALLPGQSVAGRINLAGSFPNLKRRRREGNVLLFWSYHAIEKGGNASTSRAFGGLQVPSKR